MGQPITWHNVNGASLADASRPMEIAARSMNGAFDNIRDVLKEKQVVDQMNWNNTKVNNTNAALNTINQFASPEELAAAQKSGAIQALLGNPQSDQQAIRAAADGRMATLQQRAVQGIQFDNTSRDQREAPMRDQILAKINSGIPALVAEGQAQLAKVELRNEADLAMAGNNATQQGVERGRATTKFGWEGEDQRAQMAAHADNLLTSAANRAASAASIAASKDARAATAEQRDWMREDRIADRKSKLRAEMGGLYDQVASSTGGAAKITDMINGIKDESARLNAARALPDILATPGMTTGAALNALATVEPSLWFNMDSSIQKKALATAVKGITSPEAIEQQKSMEVRKALIFEEQLKLRLREAKLNGDKDTIKELEDKLKPKAKRPPREDRE